ncbi:MAG: hypothetical protein IJ109_08365 [Firmicutes bacterium]|nr:hypothetical protein [Bacillota bacterium]
MDLLNAGIDILAIFVTPEFNERADELLKIWLSQAIQHWRHIASKAFYDISELIIAEF